MIREVRPPTAAQFAAARAAVAANLRPTPTVALGTALGTLWCKLESLQPGGSFKVRGAVAAVSAAIAERPNVQVVTCSAGNHGLGVAFAAQLTVGVIDQARASLPETVPKSRPTSPDRNPTKPATLMRGKRSWHARPARRIARRFRS